MEPKTIYEFSLDGVDGILKNLSDYKNKVLLIVNTATECRFTPQFRELEELYQRYKNNNFEIIAIPSNDFGKQEPREDDEITQYCQVNYSVSFPIYGKTKVRGKYAHPLFQYFADKKQNGKIKSVPMWNFQKYLINTDGEVVDFFYPFTKPTSKRIRKKINQLLRKSPLENKKVEKVV